MGVGVGLWGGGSPVVSGLWRHLGGTCVTGWIGETYQGSQAATKSLMAAHQNGRPPSRKVIRRKVLAAGLGNVPKHQESVGQAAPGHIMPTYLPAELGHVPQEKEKEGNNGTDMRKEKAHHPKGKEHLLLRGGG